VLCIGPCDSILIFNNIVLGGILFSKFAAVVKWLIEKSKVSEIRNEIWGSVFWAIGHIICNSLHAVMTSIQYWYLKFKYIISLFFIRRFLNRNMKTKDI
jgi:hypothetical protein